MRRSVSSREIISFNGNCGLGAFRRPRPWAPPSRPPSAGSSRDENHQTRANSTGWVVSDPLLSLLAVPSLLSLSALLLAAVRPRGLPAACARQPIPSRRTRNVHSRRRQPTRLGGGHRGGPFWNDCAAACLLVSLLWALASLCGTLTSRAHLRPS